MPLFFLQTSGNTTWINVMDCLSALLGLKSHLLLKRLWLQLIRMLLWCLHGELSLQNLWMNHRNNRLAEVTANRNKLARSKLLVLIRRLALLRGKVKVFLVASSIESRLESIWVDYAKLPEHNKTCSCLLVLLIGELAIIEVEKAVFLGKEVR